MEIQVENENPNPLLKRKEIEFILKFDDKTPSRSDVRKKIAGLYSSSEDKVVVDYIKSEFGKTEAKCYAKVYDSRESLESIEAKYIINRNKLEEPEPEPEPEPESETGDIEGEAKAESEADNE